MNGLTSYLLGAALWKDILGVGLFALAIILLTRASGVIRIWIGAALVLTAIFLFSSCAFIEGVRQSNGDPYKPETKSK